MGLNDAYVEPLIEWCNTCGVYHEYALWCKPNGHLYLTDDSGDASPILRKDADAMRADQTPAWKAYYHHVAQTGDDYLKSIVAIEDHEQQVWTLIYEQDSNGVRLVGGWREDGDPIMEPDLLHKDVYEFATGRFDHTSEGVARIPYVNYIETLEVLRDSASHVAGVAIWNDTTYRCVINVTLPTEQHKANIKQRAADIYERM